MACEVLSRGGWRKIRNTHKFFKRYKYVVTGMYSFVLSNDYGESRTVYRNFAAAEKQEKPLFYIGKNILHVYPGYAWDGSSGPTIDTDDTMAPSLFHDCVYQCIRMGYLPWESRKDADDDFRHLINSENEHRNFAMKGLTRARARLWHTSLRLFGGRAAKPRN